MNVLTPNQNNSQNSSQRLATQAKVHEEIEGLNKAILTEAQNGNSHTFSINVGTPAVILYSGSSNTIASIVNNLNTAITNAFQRGAVITLLMTPDALVTTTNLVTGQSTQSAQVSYPSFNAIFR